MKKYLFAIFCLVLTLNLNAQAKETKEDSLQIRELYDAALVKGQAYEWLEHLSNNIGGRLSGSLNAQKAVEYTKAQLEELGLDKVWLQPVMVPKWTRGVREHAYIQTGPGMTTEVNITALGGSVATEAGGLKAQIVEVQGLEDLKKFKNEIKGKIVFYNRPMNPERIQTFEAYGGCVDQRYSGAEAAAKYGAAGVIVRSLSLKIDKYPHTGSMSYGNLPDSKRIPAAAISTKDAEYLSGILKLKKDLKFYFKLSSENHGEVKSYNVIGEITGKEFPEEIMVVGGHLDSWDLGDGAHDDGAGVVQSMEVLRLFKEIGYQPKRTIRVVLFMNEENGLRGGNKYAEIAKRKNENHIFALESDAGGFTPRGFSFDADDAQFAQIESWRPLFKPYLIHYFEQGGSGADIGPLKEGDIVLAGLRPDSQRYFDYHHAATDTFERVNKRELELGAATMTSLIYLIDKYGLKKIPLKRAQKL
jgi:hypothetical protein